MPDMKKIPLPFSMLAVTFSMIWLAMCPAWNPFLVDGMLFHPDTEFDASKLPIVEGVRGREVGFGNGLTGWMFEIPKSKFVVLFSHGNAGNLSHRVDKISRLLSCGQSVFIWDYPGFGHSKGLASLKNIAIEAVSAYDYLIGRGYTANQIVLYGESLGAGINADICEKRIVKAVIVDSGFTSLHEIAKERCPIFYLYPEILMPPRSMNVRDSLNKVPSLIIHGEQDETIPYHHATDLHKASADSTLLTLPNGSHNFVNMQDSTIVESALKQFFDNLESKL